MLRFIICMFFHNHEYGFHKGIAVRLCKKCKTGVIIAIARAMAIARARSIARATLRRYKMKEIQDAEDGSLEMS